MPEHASLADREIEAVARRYDGIAVVRGGAAYGGERASRVLERHGLVSV